MQQLPSDVIPTGLGQQSVAGQSVVSSYRQIRSVIAQRLGERHACLLAVPVQDGSNSVVQWYIPDGVVGPSVPMSSLSADQQTGLTREVETLLAAIRDLGRSMSASTSASEARMGERLLKATMFPGEHCFFLVGAQPILAAWGSTRSAVEAWQGSLSKSMKAPLPATHPVRAHELLGDLPRPPSPQPTFVETVTRLLQRIGGKRGDINVLLHWASPADLDLSVVCPDGARISFSNRKAGGGELDVDMNFGDNHSDRPAENIYFAPGNAKPGNYLVLVRNSSGGYGPIDFEVVVANRGAEKRIAGTAASGQSDVYVTEFTVEPVA